MLVFRYITWHYLKYFIVILFALVLFLVAFDYMGRAEALKSANLTLIYLVYKTFFGIDMLLPISLIFAMIATKIYLIRSNALVSFYSLGYSRVDVLRPFVIVSFIVILLFISFHFSTKFSRANEYAYNIRTQGTYLNPSRDMFFVYKGQYIYFSELLPIKEKALGIRVFQVKDNSLKSVVVAKQARYVGDSWIIDKGDVITKPDIMDFSSKGIEVVRNKELRILQGFRPKVLDQVYLGQVDFSIQDALSAYSILREQGLDTSSIRGSLYRIIIYPFFAPLLVVIIFFFVPISARFFNVTLFSFVAILSTLVIWGVLYMLSELSNHKTLTSEVAILLPMFVLFLISIGFYKKHS